jgi:hypothetical protein
LQLSSENWGQVHALILSYRDVEELLAERFRSFWGAWRTIAGYEAIHMIRKGQACWSAVGEGRSAASLLSLAASRSPKKGR